MMELKEMMPWEAACEAMGLLYSEATVELYDAACCSGSLRLLFEMQSALKDADRARAKDLKFIMRPEVLRDFAIQQVEAAISENIPCFLFEDGICRIASFDDALSRVIQEKDMIYVRDIRLQVDPGLPFSQRGVPHNHPSCPRYSVSSIILADESKALVVAYEVGLGSEGRQPYDNH